jgi:hypothetical protein
MKKLCLSLVSIIFIGIVLSGCNVTLVEGSEAGGFWNLWIWNIFVFGGFGFWVYFTVLVIILSICADDDDWWSAICWFSFIGLMGMWLFGAFNPFGLLFAYVIENPLLTGVWIGGYIIAGIVWACMKLKGESIRLAREYKTLRRYFLKENKIDEITPDFEEKWKKFTDSYEHQKTLKPTIESYKGDLIFWMTWWPFSIAHTIIADYIIRIYETIYKHFEGFFDSILKSSLEKQIAKDEDKKRVGK